MAKCLVTGGAGFIGSHLADKLIEKGYEVVVLDNLFSSKKSYINFKVKFYEVDIRSKEVERIFQKEKPDYVFHLAAQVDVRKSLEDYIFDNDINVLGGLNILESCKKYNVKKVIFSSTGGAIYGDTNEIPTSENFIPMPTSPYGIHKLTFEKYLNCFYNLFGQEYIALRFANVYGPRQYGGGGTGVISIFIDNALKNKTSIINGDGTQTRDYVYVDDVVKALVIALKNSFVGEVNIGSGKETSLLDIVDMIEKALQKQVRIEYGHMKDGEQMRSCLDCKKSKSILNWEPEVGLEEGLKYVISFLKNESIKNKFV